MPYVNITQAIVSEDDYDVCPGNEFMGGSNK